MIALVAAIGLDGGIGFQGRLPWRFPEDMEHFRELTTGHTVVLGRRTHLGIARALPRRRNIVVSRKLRGIAVGCEVATSLSEALALAGASRPDKTVFLAGGARIYQEGLPFATRLYITEVACAAPADTFFHLDTAGFAVTERRSGRTPELTFVTYDRLPPPSDTAR